MSLERVAKVVGQVMNVKAAEINRASSPETIENWDSLQHMNLILALEEEFQVKFTDENIVSMVSVGIIEDTLKKKGVGQ